MVKGPNTAIDHGSEEPTAADDHARTELSRELSTMVSDLNEVRMRLDAVVRKLADASVDGESEPDGLENVESLRIKLAGQLDRIRQKLLSRMPGDL